MSVPAGTLAPVVTRSTIKVASIPASHVYVRHLSDPLQEDGVERLPDAAPPDGRRVPWGWWPPVMLDPDWLSDHASSFDLVHVHFGFDEATAAKLEDIADCLRELARPLLYTVHDLRNPHQPDSREHEALLDVLIPRADGLLTLTSGAAREIARRWHRHALVLPHPHVLELEGLERARLRREEFVIGVHAKSVRASMDPLAVAVVLGEVVRELESARVRVDVHDEIFDPESHWYAPDVGSGLQALADAGSIELRVHPYFSDRELWDYLAALDVSVLPYRFGTHSGWLEACYDLGTTVIAPDCGFYSEQRPVLTYAHHEEGLDADSLAHAVLEAYRRRPRWQATRRARLHERARIAQAHRRLYEEVLAR